MEIEALRDTEYKAVFDFGFPAQYEILGELQENGYKLMGYKGATGTNQVKCGLPTWFSESFIEMYGLIEIDHRPLYRVYVHEESQVDEYSEVEMHFQSDVYPLGTTLQLNADHSFSVIDEKSPTETITLVDNRHHESKNIIVGLASFIIGRFSPFCAFISIAQEKVNMKPNNKICLFTAQTDIKPRQIIQNLTGMGCTFEFNDSQKQIALKVTQMPWGITKANSKMSLKMRFPNQPISKILNIT